MAEKNVTVSPAAMDRAIERAETAARHSPAVLMIKAEYYLKTGRLAEAEAAFEALRRHTPNKARHWLDRIEKGKP